VDAFSVDFNVKKDNEEKLFDWVTGKQIILNNNKGTVKILPKSGKILFLGTPKEFNCLKKLTK
jgi:hypothetical protein